MHSHHCKNVVKRLARDGESLSDINQVGVADVVLLRWKGLEKKEKVISRSVQNPVGMQAVATIVLKKKELHKQWLRRGRRTAAAILATVEWKRAAMPERVSPERTT